MKEQRLSRAGRALTCGLLVALLAACVALVGTGDARAQAKDWTKIKFPEPKAFKIPQPERYVMDNGIVVLLMEDHELPLIRLEAWIRTGSRLEPADKAGLASIEGSVLRTGGAGARTGDEIDDWLDARGARIETGVGRTSGTASLSCLKGDFPDVIRVFSDILRHPKFEEKKIQVAETQMKSGIARRNDNQQGIMHREEDRLIYGADSPYARNAEYDTVDAITRDDLVAFHAKYYIPNRTIIGITGDFNSADAKQLLQQVFGDWKRGPDFKDPEAAYSKTAHPGIYFIKKEDVTQSAVIMGHLGIREDDPDFYAAQVMNEVFSGSFASRLFNNIRSVKGLAYAVTGGLHSNYDYPGTFNVWLTTKTETTAAAIDAMLKEVDSLVKAPPTAEEMERAKESMRNSFIFNYDSKWKILNQQIRLEYYHYPADFLAKYEQNVQKVTADDVFRVAKKDVRRGDLAILVVGKSEGMDRPLASFGKVTTLDITIPEPSAAPSTVASVPGMSDEEALAKGKDLLAKLMASMGGAAAIDGVKNLRFVANVSAKTSRGEMQVKTTQIYLLPDKISQEMQTPMGNVFMVVSPQDAFLKLPTGVRDLPDSQKDQLLKATKRLEVAMFQARNEPGFTARYAGTEKIGGADCDLLAVSRDGDTMVYAVNRASGQLVRSSYQGHGMQGVPGKIDSFYSDYRKVGDLTFPFKVKQTFNGEDMSSVEVQEIGVNEQVSDALFARPSDSSGSDSPGGK